MKRHLVVLWALLALPMAARAQAPALRVATTEGVREFAAAPGLAAFYPVGALAALGGAVHQDARGARVILFGDTLGFTVLSPFFTVGDGLAQLAVPIRRVSGVVFVPEQFFIAWLPGRYPARITYGGGTLRIQAPVAAATDATSRERVPSAAGTPAGPPAAAKPATRVVVLDPGHGGRDPGKIGPTGLREKDVALALSNRLGRLLRERGYEVHFTRTTDTLIALGDRPRIANRLKANRPALFLSIHANSVVSSRVQGFETFFLSEARTEDERRVAEMENAAVEYEERPENGDVVDQILNDIRNDFYVRASSDLAEAVQDRLASFHSGPNRGVKRAGFRVLVGALMPAVLVEVAFISNVDEARLLGTSAFQQKVAWGLADAVDGFFERNQHLWAAGSQ